MISVSDAWKDIQQRFLLPESYIEIDCGLTDDEAQKVATASGTNEAIFSNASALTDALDVAKYATNELNLWALDGTRAILPSSGVYNNAGYVSNVESTGSVMVSFPTIRTTAVSGITITWSRKYGEYPTVFSVIGANAGTIVSEVTVTDNTENVSIVNIPLENYDSIIVSVHAWNLPYRRARIEKIVIGHMLIFTKKDLLSFTHEQDGDLLSGQVPKYSIEFTLDNSDGRWDPNNPYGMGQYLSERQKVVVRYGLDVNGIIEWIKAGTFYLSEWSAPPNGLEARFVARDVFEYLLSPKFDGSSVYGNLAHLVTTATSSFLPNGVPIMDASLSSSAGREATDGTAAEWVQKCANTARCILRYDRDGTLNIETLNKTNTGYIIPLSLSYSYPEITLSKPLKEVSVNYYNKETVSDANINEWVVGGNYTTAVSSDGETQSVSNDFIRSEAEATSVAQWIADTLKSRKTISGEFRADPRLDAYDIVQVEDRYGKLLTVVITSVKYTFNGSFRGSYTGRVLEEV